jgi:hypothetical protein
MLSGFAALARPLPGCPGAMPRGCGHVTHREFDGDVFHSPCDKPRERLPPCNASTPGDGLLDARVHALTCTVWIIGDPPEPSTPTENAYDPRFSP